MLWFACLPEDVAQKIRYSQQVPPFMVHDFPLNITRRIAGNMGFDYILFGPLTAWWDSVVRKPQARFEWDQWGSLECYFSGISVGFPSGKHTKNYGTIHHFQWEDPLLIAMFNGYLSLPESN